jgi:4-hydroxy-3-methylbut-2-enyl diphosphate reductase
VIKRRGMPKQFDIPRSYRSDIIGAVKKKRAAQDGRKEDLSATELDLGPVVFRVARFFGFCYGVENAIEIAYRALDENPGKRIFLLSEMIHNPHVNADLISRGVSFLQTAEGQQLISFSELGQDDVVIVPAFGTTREIFERLEACGLNPQSYNATCPFVEKVWKRGRQLAQAGYSIVIHGKHTHEETRATFSQVRVEGPSVVVRDREEAELLARYVRGEEPHERFAVDFKGRFSLGFRVPEDLMRIGVVNQTTMLAEETHEIAQMMRKALVDRYGAENIGDHFADTRDTLCYATSENQRSMRALLEQRADVAVIVGGYNSSNTSHLVELCQGRLPVFYVKDADEIISRESIRHLDLQRGVVVSHDWLPDKPKVEILISAGASCPDAMVEAVLARIAGLFPGARELARVAGDF